MVVTAALHRSSDAFGPPRLSHPHGLRLQTTGFAAAIDHLTIVRVKHEQYRSAHNAYVDHAATMRASTATSAFSPRSLENGDLAGSEGIELSDLRNPATSSAQDEAIANAPVKASSSIRDHESPKAEQSAPVHTQPTSGFQRLPAEVRNRIYHYATPMDKCIWPHTYKPATRARSLNDCHNVYRTAAEALQATSVPPILQICQMMRKEAYPLYLADNVFVLHLGPVSFQETLDWLKAMPSEYISCLRRIIVQGVVQQWKAHSAHNNHFAVTLDIQTRLLKTLVEVRGGQTWIHPTTPKIESVWRRFAEVRGRGDMTATEQKEAFVASVKEVHHLLRRARWRYRFNKTFSIKRFPQLSPLRVFLLTIHAAVSILIFVLVEVVVHFVVLPRIHAAGKD
ncbi:hypothetical protein LTR35_006766 [Friedmanniomyces endolithicus]|uniref:2EXR domain-containing protein n=2 Tax=Friedmanniomyces endolithicus TaxID=329885 RepID=A0AAN6J3W4_9PEZI|nr:hypothetical protein LTR35_006766 [Friedmanniomyces endolithicus]KAK0304382.1 hypothetical protein LTR01_007483 [Friedmanniomyces endolithicus]KAK0315050.1 hypothetical protein LTR82_012831 [Friedmanniomyces endolithicus]KAK0983688.1 hypothetical protein LTS01_010955 [Friedmanniomyces endolithicus]